MSTHSRALQDDSSPPSNRCEDRAITTLVFVLNGSSFAAAGPNNLTANAAAVLQQAGNRVVQLANPAINTAAAFHALARSVVNMAHGQPIGLVGFSAGGALALHIAATPGLQVKAVLDYYGVPDVQAYLNRHRVDHVFARSPASPRSDRRSSLS